jgi:RNA polymerase sigma-70 factor (ECF subfamily)
LKFKVEMQQAEWLKKAQRGDPIVLGELFERYHHEVFWYLYYRVGDMHIAEDLTSEVFLRMLAALPGYRPLSASFQAWVFQIARNISIDHYRRSNHRQDTELGEDIPVDSADPLKLVEQGLTAERLHQALTMLPDSQRDVIILRFINGLPIGDVAQALHKSEDAIKGLQRRALSALRDQLAEWEVVYV